MDINEILDKLPPAPAGVESWIRKELVNKTYLIYNKKENKVVCTRCGHTYRADRIYIERNLEGECPRCHSKGTYKPSGVGRRNLDEHVRVLIFVHRGKTVYGTLTEVTVNFSPFGKPQLDRWLSAIYVFNDKEQIYYKNHPWYGWCKDNLGYTQKQAQRFMQIARTYGNENSPYSNVTNLADLSISKALALLQVPEEQVENFVETHDVDSMKFKELEEEIKALKANNEDAEERALKATNLALSFEKQLDELKASGADPEKIAELEAKLEKQKEKNKKLTEDLKAEKDSKEKAIAEALDEKAVELQRQARQQSIKELEAAKHEKEELQERIEALTRKLENSSNENTLAFKLRVDQLQEVFSECMECIKVEVDPDTEQRMRTALGTVMDSLKGGM